MPLRPSHNPRIAASATQSVSQRTQPCCAKLIDGCMLNECALSRTARPFDTRQEKAGRLAARLVAFDYSGRPFRCIHDINQPARKAVSGFSGRSLMDWAAKGWGSEE